MNNHLRTSWSAALVTLAITGACLIATPAATATAHRTDASFKRAMCLGKPATIVGRPNTRLTGTNGPDVIVSNGANTVIAGRGADLVCLTGSERGNSVKAGGGDDRVLNQVQDESGFADLGDGRDWYFGGPFRDSVTAYGGNDTVRLGAGADALRATVTRGPGALLSGGTGRDSAQFFAAPGLPGPLVVDAARGRFRAGATTPVRTLTGFEEFDLGDDRKVTSFLGSAASEEVVIEGRIGTVELRAGNDAFLLDRSYPLSFENRFTVADGIRGGKGNDLFTFNSRSGNLVVDLLAGYIDILRTNDTKRFTLAGFNSLDLNSTEADVRGTAAANTVSLISCQGTVDVAGGNDTVGIRAPYNDSFGYYCPDETIGMTLLGGEGDDTLVGGSLNDTLTGGDGTDSVDGSEGVHQCDAEVVINCESAVE